jgi:hypothetical protein
MAPKRQELNCEEVLEVYLYFLLVMDGAESSGGPPKLMRN